MMVRGSLDLGVQAVVAITFGELEFVNSKRKIQIEYSSEQKTWFAKSRRIQDYESILSNYGVTPRFVNQLALKISGYDMHLVPPRLIYQTKRMAYRIRSAFEKALNSSNWIGRDIRDELINKLIDVTFYVGSQGRRSDPAFVEEVYRIMQSPFLYLYGPIALNYGGLGMLSLSGQHETLNDTVDSENLADLVGTMVAYAAYSSSPQKYKDVKLVNLDISTERLFFINHCVKWCAERTTLEKRYAPLRSRCIVPLMNMPEFSGAFGCAPGSPMNPREKCAFW
ncbi:hypothetical protein MRX96_054592 [Rhipicephalus microplus]